jgi:hypothetical protein
MDEAPHLVARRLVGIGRPRGERARAAMDVGIFMRVKGGEPVDHGLLLLRGRAVVEPDRPASVDLLLKDRKIVADRTGVERPRPGACIGEDRSDSSGRRCRRDCRWSSHPASAGNAASPGLAGGSLRRRSEEP